MAVDDTLKNIFEQLAALKAHADASYQQGFRDGLARAMEVLTGELQQAESARSELAEQPHQLRARRGSVPSRILDTLETRDGATYQEIASLLDLHGTPTPLPSLRSAMRRLLDGNRVKADGNRWFLVRSSRHRAQQGTEGAAGPPLLDEFTSNDGAGHRSAA
jgi:hypothetical protein